MTCNHHYVLDSQGYGRCKKCGVRRQFPKEFITKQIVLRRDYETMRLIRAYEEQEQKMADDANEVWGNLPAWVR